MSTNTDWLSRAESSVRAFRVENWALSYRPAVFRAWTSVLSWRHPPSTRRRSRSVCPGGTTELVYQLPAEACRSRMSQSASACVSRYPQQCRHRGCCCCWPLYISPQSEWVFTVRPSRHIESHVEGSLFDNQSLDCLRATGAMKMREWKMQE